MTGATAMAAGSSDGPADESSASRNDIGAFFAAVAAMQRETVLRFEGTVGRLTGLAMNGAGATDRDLIMTLQDFDRLQQEFAALGEMLARFGMIMGSFLSSHNLSDHLDRHVIADISISDLKERLLRHYRGEADELDPSTVLDEAIF
jgi:hypothetical protein